MTSPAIDVSHEESWWTRATVGRMLLCALAVCPFLSLYARHFMPSNGVPTGFLIYDMPSYGAQGRAAFERGNGISFPSPGNPDPHAPPIYFHWFSWLLGFGIVKLGLDPGVLFVGLGIISSLLCAWLTLLLVEAVLPGPHYKALLYLFTMWGGGFMCLAAIVVNLLRPMQPWDHDILRYDPVGGWWFLNWGRNLMFPTEATYHVVVAACWLAVLKERWALAALAAAAIGATHPFTGFEVLLILCIWTGLCAGLERSRRALYRWSVFIALLAIFVAYNFVFLERFPEHHSVREQMTVAWTLDFVPMVLAYTGVGILAAARLARDWPRFDRQKGFLLVCFGTALLLANHGRFVRPHQPIHFTRGYIWMPLCLLGLPLLQHLFIQGRRWLGRTGFSVAAALLMAVGMMDNAGFIMSYWRLPIFGIVLTPSQWDALEWMSHHRLQGAFVSSNPLLTYLASTYTSVRSYYSHGQHTPHYAKRRADAGHWFGTGAPAPWLAQIDYLLVPRQYERLTLERLSKADQRHWMRVYANQDWTIIGHDE
jgi:hypothetical protein